MKIGLVGYDKVEIESALQAFAVKEFLKSYNIDSVFINDWKIENEKELVLKQFVEDNVGFNNKDEITHFIMINYKAMVDMTGSKAAYRDYYQHDFTLKDQIIEALFLCKLSDYDKITKPYDTTQNYVLLDCANASSPLHTLAKKHAKDNQLKIVTIFQEKQNQRGNSVAVYDPKEYLGIIQGAQFVITDSFMTLWFAILNRIPFIVQDNPSLPGKNKRFLKRLGLMKRYGFKGIYILEGYQAANDNNLEQNIIELQTEGIDYLLEHLPNTYKDSTVDAPPRILKSECCGCYTCKEVCPVSAITMVQDEEGFYYPHVNDKCIDCGLCSKRCVKKEKQQLVEFEQHYPRIVCAINEDETVRLKSSSGGVFSVLARYVIEEKKGVVFGVKFDENMVAISTIARTMEEVEAFYGSKYVKSEIDGVYKQVKEQLTAGTQVLYSALPCECAGLRAYLNKDYDNLLICEILCHAAPSPAVFQDYIQYISKKFHGKVKNVKFREKSKGWLIHQCNMVFEFTNREPVVVNSRRNNYFRNFLIDNISRPGCSTCSFTKLNRVGDLTIGDFWGINKIDEEMHDNKGTSAILINNKKGNDIWEAVSTGFKMKEMTVAQLFKNNHSKPMPLKNERNKFFRRFRTMPINDLLLEYNDLKS